MISLKTIRSTKEIFLYKNILKQPSKVQKPETAPDQPEIFMDEPVWEYKFACIKKFSIGPTMFKWYPIAPRRRTTKAGVI